MKSLAVTLLLACSLPLDADEVARSRSLQQEAVAAREAGDLATYARAMEHASRLRPQHPTLLMNYAAALAVNGRMSDALAVVNRVAAMGFKYSLDHAAFATLLPAADGALARFATNGQPHGKADVAFRLDRRGTIAEGLAWDAKRRRHFVSSVRNGTILVRERDGSTRIFAQAPWGAFGMAVDEPRKALWVTTTALPQFEKYEAALEGHSALLRYDLTTGRLVSRLEAPDAGKHHFGDVTVAENGEVFVSDGAANVIYRLAGERLERFADGFTALQGVTPSGPFLYVADYSRGLMAVNRRTRDAVTLRLPDDVSTLGIDGLYHTRCLGSGCFDLVATQNGTNPNRILGLRLSPDGLGIASAETLLANAPPLRDPTLGVVAGERFLFNANAQWDAYGEDGKLVEGAELEEAVVLSVPLRR